MQDAADDPESSSFDDLVPGDLDHHDQSAKSGSREQLSEECSHEVRKQLRQVTPTHAYVRDYIMT